MQGSTSQTSGLGGALCTKYVTDSGLGGALCRVVRHI